MASVKNFDLYTCKVCLENMLDQNPLSLSCLHTFCTDCLQQLMKGGAILCPTCREITVVPNKNITSLKANFMLQEVKAHLDEVLSSKALFCQLCLAESAVLKCQQCIQLLCDDCSLKHNEVKTFKDHKLFKLCPKHAEGMITHLCMKCVQPSCSKCVMMEHLDHEADIEMFDDGIKLIKENITEYETDIELTAHAVKYWKDKDYEQLESIEGTISKVKDIKEFHLQKVKEAEDGLEILYKDKEKGEERQKEYEVKITELKTVLDGLKRPQNIHTDFLIAFKNLKQEAEKLLDEAKERNLRFVREEINILDPKTNECVADTINDKPEIYLEKPEFVKTISCPGNQKWGRPYNISSVQEDCVLISDWDKDFITMAYSSDTPTVKIPAQYGRVRDACLFNDSLYTAYDNFITKRTFTNGTAGPEFRYNPNINDIWSMKVLNESCVLLLSESENRIAEYNPNINQTKTAVSNLREPVNINIMRNEGEVLYLVTCHGTHSVDVYDEKWKLVRTFGGRGQADGQMTNPEGTTFTKQGILVADYFNSQISLYSTEGNFIKHILTKNDRIGDPVILSYTRPLLWMSQDGRPSVKCYKLCQ